MGITCTITWVNKTIKTMYLNARSLKSVTTNVNKVRDFSALIELSQSDIYGITETWLNSNIFDCELFMFNIKYVVVFWHLKKEIISRRP